MEWSWRARVALVIIVLSTAVAPASTGCGDRGGGDPPLPGAEPPGPTVPLVVRIRRCCAACRDACRIPTLPIRWRTPLGVRDEFLTFQQELPITGRRGLLNERAEVAASAAGLAAERDFQGEVFDLKRSFHEVLYRERVLERLRSGAELLVQTVEILEEREREGEGSGYDVLRAEQELAELRMTTAAADAALAPRHDRVSGRSTIPT